MYIQKYTYCIYIYVYMYLPLSPFLYAVQAFGAVMSHPKQPAAGLPVEARASAGRAQGLEFEMEQQKPEACGGILVVRAVAQTLHILPATLQRYVTSVVSLAEKA